MSGSAKAGTTAERHPCELTTSKITLCALSLARVAHVCFSLTEDLHGCRSAADVSQTKPAHKWHIRCGLGGPMSPIADPNFRIADNPRLEQARRYSSIQPGHKISIRQRSAHGSSRLKASRGRSGIWSGRRLAEQRLRRLRPSRAGEQSDARGDAQHEQRQPPPVHRVDASA